MERGEMTTSEVAETVTYTVFRTGDMRHRHYQINKMVMGVKVDDYWVQLSSRDSVSCSCPGFRRQNFPPMEHKHIKLAQNYSERGEPIKAEYRIHGAGANAIIEVVK